MSTSPAATTIDGLFFGAVEDRWPGKDPSAIRKTPVSGPQKLGLTGFEGDRQADLTVHGGKDKAVHHYPADHYSAWSEEGVMPAGTTPAAFGENISAKGFTEETVFIGDTFRIGSALLQVSQGRQPCWKLNRHTENEQMAYRFQKTGRTGWYYRVLEEGEIASGDEMILLERPHEEWSVKRVTQARLTKRIAPEEAATLAAMDLLEEGWRSAFAKMAKGDLKENTDRRLKG
ncbi:MAG: MOSC domain-containing protein [Pseudomonadota bacterium]